MDILTNSKWLLTCLYIFLNDNLILKLPKNLQKKGLKSDVTPHRTKGMTRRLLDPTNGPWAFILHGHHHCGLRQVNPHEDDVSFMAWVSKCSP